MDASASIINPAPSSAASIRPLNLTSPVAGGVLVAVAVGLGVPAGTVPVGTTVGVPGTGVAVGVPGPGVGVASSCSSITTVKVEPVLVHVPVTLPVIVHVPPMTEVQDWPGSDLKLGTGKPGGTTAGLLSFSFSEVCTNETFFVSVFGGNCSSTLKDIVVAPRSDIPGWSSTIEPPMVTLSPPPFCFT